MYGHEMIEGIDELDDDITIKIRIPIRVAKGALDALYSHYTHYDPEEDPIVQEIHNAYWGNDFYDLREAVESGIKNKRGS